MKELWGRKHAKYGLVTIQMVTADLSKTLNQPPMFIHTLGCCY